MFARPRLLGCAGFSNARRLEILPAFVKAFLVTIREACVFFAALGEALVGARHGARRYVAVRMLLEHVNSYESQPVECFASICLASFSTPSLV